MLTHITQLQTYLLHAGVAAHLLTCAHGLLNDLNAVFLAVLLFRLACATPYLLTYALSCALGLLRSEVCAVLFTYLLTYRLTDLLLH